MDHQRYFRKHIDPKGVKFTVTLESVGELVDSRSPF